MAYAFRARNLGPLREIDWRIPEGVSVVVGPNGVGKSTLLRLPDFVRIALQKSINDAVTEIFDGTAYLKHLGAAATDKMTFGASLSSFSENFPLVDWDVELNVPRGSFDAHSAERLQFEGLPALHRAAGSSIVTTADDQRALPWDMYLLPRGIADRVFGLNAQSDVRLNALQAKLDATSASTSSPAIDPRRGVSTAVFFIAMTNLTRAYRTYEYEVTRTAKYGSIHSPDTTLHADGTNVFSLLRNWRINSDNEFRYDFVLSTLREAFPHVEKLDFEQAGQTVTVAVVDRRYAGKKTPISRESTGFLTALMQLCAVASCSGLVTLDELETSLHPRAVKVLIEAFRGWANKHELSIVLATQSETVLDQFQDDPSRISVLEPNMTPAPKPLTELFTREWLSQFSVGDLFGHLEYGSLPTG